MVGNNHYEIQSKIQTWYMYHKTHASNGRKLFLILEKINWLSFGSYDMLDPAYIMAKTIKLTCLESW